MPIHHTSGLIIIEGGGTYRYQITRTTHLGPVYIAPRVETRDRIVAVTGRRFLRLANGYYRWEITMRNVSSSAVAIYVQVAVV
jgi:hypothetical protein